jgi:hypothetical protein
MFKDIFSRKILEAQNIGELLDFNRQAEEYIPKLPDEGRQGFAFSYANYEAAIEGCRRLKRMKFHNVERIEMMVGVRELPYPFTCVAETSSDKMSALDEEMAGNFRNLDMKDDETGVATIASLINEKQSLLRRDTWETDPQLIGFTEWEE